MKIIKTINGVKTEIELDFFEMQHISREFDHICHMDDINARLEFEDFALTTAQIEEAADLIDDLLSNYDYYWDCYWEAVDVAIKSVVEEEEKDETDEM